MLIDAGADVNATTPSPCTEDVVRGVWQFGDVSSLQLSASQADEGLVLQLLRAGADPCQSFAIPVMSSLCTSDLSSSAFGDDVEMWQFVTPLIWAVKLRKVSVVNVLLSKQNQSFGGIDVNAIPCVSSRQTCTAVSNSNSWTPLMWAIANVAEHSAALIASSSELSLSSSSNHSCSEAHQILDLLLRCPETNPNAGSTSEDATPLSLAAALGLENVIQLLVDAGASVADTAALFEATSFAHPNCLRLLCHLAIERHTASSSERSRVVQLLVQCLDVAAISGLLECAQILTSTFSELARITIACGGSDNFSAEWEKGLTTALLHSCANGQPHLTTFLQPLALYSPAVLGSALRKACKNGDVTSCEKLISVGANGDWMDAQEQKSRIKGGCRTAISAAFKRWGRTGIAEYEACCSLLLVSCSSSAVNVRDTHGNTPLKWAAIQGHHLLVRALLDKGADLFAEDSDGNTPISHAVMNGHSIIVCELVDREPQLYKVRIKVPAYFKVYEVGLLPPAVPISSRQLHLSIFETAFKPQITKQAPNVLCALSLKGLKLVNSLNPILVSAHHHESVVSTDSESYDVPYLKEHLHILKIRDIGSSCPDLPLPKHVCYGDLVSEVARIGMRAPMMRLIRHANAVGKGVSDIRSRDGDSLLMLCSGQIGAKK